MAKRKSNKKDSLYPKPKPFSGIGDANEDVKPFGKIEKNPKKGKFAAELRPKKPKQDNNNSKN